MAKLYYAVLPAEVDTTDVDLASRVSCYEKFTTVTSLTLHPTASTTTGAKVVYEILVLDESKLPDAGDDGIIEWKGSKAPIPHHEIYAIRTFESITGHCVFFYVDNHVAWERFTPKGSVNSHNMAGLFRDYHSPRGGRFFSGHWNRHHAGVARQLEAALSDASATNQTAIAALLGAKTTLLASSKNNRVGSMLRRIDWAIYQLAREESTPSTALTATAVPGAARLGGTA